MKLLLISAYPYRGQNIGGVSTAAQYLVDNLVQSDDIEEIFIFSLKAGIKTYEVIRAENPKVTVCFVPVQKRLALLAYCWPDYFKLWRLLKSLSWRPDIIHGQGLTGEGLLAIRLGEKLHVPVVVSVHGMVDIETRMRSESLRGILVRRMMKSILIRANGVIFISRYRMGELSTLCKGKVFLIDNPVKDVFFLINKFPERRDGKIIIVVGFLIRRKCITDLIRAFKIVHDTMKETILHIIGPSVDPKYDQEIRMLITQLGIKDEVKLLGEIEEEDLVFQYRQASVLTMTSLEETAPQVIAQALASGVPVVSTMAGGVPFMVKDGENGFLVPIGDIKNIADRILFTLRNDKEWEQLSRGAQVEGERFRGRNIAKYTINAYKEILSNGTK
jgi:glycosyltransferase involved in cell wall biosynthesis